MQYRLNIQANEIYAQGETDLLKIARLFGMVEYQVLDEIIKPCTERGFIIRQGYRITVEYGIEYWNGNRPQVTIYIRVKAIEE